jgi:hypothetical protein
MTDPELRDFSAVLRLRDVQAVGRPYKYLEGRAVPYDEWAPVRTQFGGFLERHQHGSFKRSTSPARPAGQRLPLLLFHDNRSLSALIGHAESWAHPADGLHGVWKLNESAEAQEAARKAEAGDLVGLSIGFNDAGSPAWEDGDPFSDDPDELPRVTRLESRLIEVSMTPTPAFAAAEVTMVRSAWRPPTPPTPPPREVDRWRAIADGLRSP